MTKAISYVAATALGVLLITSISCDSSDGNSMLGNTGDTAFATVRFGESGEMPIDPGLTVGLDRDAIALDPCAFDVPTDDMGRLRGSAMIAAFVRDADLQPLVGVEVTFQTSAGTLASMGPVLTDTDGMASDTLTVNEDDAGDVLVTVSADGFDDVTLTVPVLILEKPDVMLELSPGELWPPNHRMREIEAEFPGIACYPDATVSLVDIVSNEPDNGLGDGDTVDDIQDEEIGTDDLSFSLRAERAGGGTGRIYEVTYEVDLGDGTLSTLTGTVRVPHDQGGSDDDDDDDDDHEEGDDDEAEGDDHA